MSETADWAFTQPAAWRKEMIPTLSAD